MILAAVCPLLAGYAGLVIADVSVSPARVLVARTVAVGRLVPLDVVAEGDRRNARREVDDDAAEDVAVSIVPELRARGVTRCVVEYQTRTARRTYEAGTGIEAAVRVAHAIERGCSRAGIEAERVGIGWRLRTSLANIEASIAGGFASWPADVPYRAARYAGAILLASRGTGPAKRGRKAAGAPALAHAAQTGADQTHAEAVAPRGQGPKDSPAGDRADYAAPDPRDDRQGLGARTESLAVRALPLVDLEPRTGGAPSPRDLPAADRTLPLVPLGPRVAGLDPGSTYVGLAIAEGERAPLRYVYATTYDVGERVARAKPLTGKRPDGTTYVSTHKHTVSAEHVDAVATAVMRDLERHGVQRLVIEHADTVRMDPRNPSAHTSIATAMVRQAWVDGVIGERAQRAGIVVERVAAVTWRGIVAGRSGRGGSGAERIPGAVAAGITGWTSADEHALDAAGLCLWAVREPDPPPVPRERAARAPRSPRARAATPATSGARERAKAKARAAADARAAERRAAGCACTSPRHVRGCPLFRAMVYRPAAGGVPPSSDSSRGST